SSGQREVKAGRLKHASELFLTCSSTPGCPNAIRGECSELYDSLQKAVPTVIFTATDEQGRDITNVKVYSSDQLLVDSLTGRPVPLDPGKHHFRFVMPAGDVLTSDALVREGEKNRSVAVQVRPASAGLTSPSVVRTPPKKRLPEPPPSRSL